MQHHVNELRIRLLWPVLFLLVGGGIGYALHTSLIKLLRTPLNQALYYSSPAGNFNFIMKISFIIGIVLALPVLVYNIVRFVQPVFSTKVKQKHVYYLALFSLVLAIAGAAFAFYVVVPMSLHFFFGFNVDGVKPLLAADDYLNFVLNCIVTFIVVFQIPLLMLFINRIKPLPPKKLLKLEKYVIVGSLAIALILPFSYDPLTQFLIALPIIGLYNTSLLLVWLVNRKRPENESLASVQQPVANLRALHMPLASQEVVAKPVIVADTKPVTVVPQYPEENEEPSVSHAPRRINRYMDFVPIRSQA